jgi:hypothetical protein
MRHTFYLKNEQSVCMWGKVGNQKNRGYRGEAKKDLMRVIKQAGGIALYATQELNNVVIKPWEG